MTPRTYDLRDGSTMEFRRVGVEFSSELRNPAGETIATVPMSEYDAYSIMLDIEKEYAK